MKKLLPLLVLILLIPSQALAMEWPYWGQINTATNSNTAARFYPCMSGAVTVAQTSAISARTPVSNDITFADSYFNLTAPPGAGTQYEAQLFVNGVGTNIDMVIANTATTSSDADTATITAGQTCYWQVTPTGSPTGSWNFNIGGSATTVTGAGFTLSGGTTGTVVNNVNSYFLPGTAAVATTTESDASGIVPLNGTIDDLQVELDGTPGGTATYVITLYRNEVATGLTCTVASGVTPCSDTNAIHAVAVVPGDRVSIEAAPVATPTARRVRASIRVVPTTDGQSILWSRNTNASNAGTRFQAISGALSGNGGIAGATTTAPINFQLSNLWATTLRAPGGGKSWAFDNSINGIPGTLATTTSGATATTSADLIHSDNIVAGQAIAWRSIPTGTPAALNKMVESAIAFIAVPVTATTASIILGLVRVIWIQ